MVLVIPLRNNDPGTQLRYALRSITQHMPITRCIVVGGKPRWYVGYHISFPDYTPERKEENIRDKVMAGAEVVQGEFLMANDDHFILAPITQTYNCGTLSQTLSKRIGNGYYTRLLRNTLQHYGDVPNVDAHVPMFMHTEGVKRTCFPWPHYGLGFKTCYAQENNVPSIYYPDMKLDRPCDLTGREWFSVSDVFPVKALEKMFNIPCKFEK